MLEFERKEYLGSPVQTAFKHPQSSNFQFTSNMDYLNKALGGSGDRPTDGSRDSERAHQTGHSEGRYDEGQRYDNPGRGEEGRREEGQSSGGFLGSLGDKFGGAPQKGHQTEQSKRNEEGGGGFLGGIGNKLNAAAGGGPESEKNEDYLDKGVLH